MISSFTSYDKHLFHEGKHNQCYKIFGAHITKKNSKKGVQFTVWAPNAEKVCVVGDFNQWQGNNHCMKRITTSGIWSIFIPNINEGSLYKYEIFSLNQEVFLKADPYAFYSESPPETASIVYNLDNYKWSDLKWRKEQQSQNQYPKPILIYEVHLASWKKNENSDYLSYKELAHNLVDYVSEMGYTHIELLPITEHPYDGSWGYQSTGYYSATSRYGNPKDFMYFIDCCHKKNIAVILDWVPGHFCKDAHGLRKFDGTPLYENSNHILSERLEWGTLNFDFHKPEVISFLISNIFFWLDYFHIDGIRVDAVASMLYLDFGKEDGQWIPNKYGGNENLEAISFMKRLNKFVFENFPYILMIAEESSEWPLVTKPTYIGGLGYNYKWNMGWMNDILKYMEMDPLYRKWHHNLITFSFMYTFSENFLLPLSHDEVVHGKKSLIDKMPGDYWQKFANLRTLYGYMMAHPGKKLLFMGSEFGQFIEWRYYEELEWLLLDYNMHKNLQTYVKELNNFYKKEVSLWEIDHNWNGFEWIDANNYEQSIIIFMRKSKIKKDFLIIVTNFTSVVYHDYKIGVPLEGTYEEAFNSDCEKYGGSGQKNKGILKTQGIKWHNQSYSIDITVPPLSTIFIKPKKIINKNKVTIKN